MEVARTPREEANVYGRGYNAVRFGPPVTPDIIKYLMIVNVGVLVLQALATRSLPLYPMALGSGALRGVDAVTCTADDAVVSTGKNVGCLGQVLETHHAAA